MPDTSAPVATPCCSRCGPDADGETIPFGFTAETFEEAAERAKAVTASLGCDVFVAQRPEATGWCLELQALCVYNLAEERAPDCAIDHLNHPAHYIGKPFHVRGKNLDYQAALERAQQELAKPGSSVMISYGPGWCVNVATTPEEARQAQRLSDHFHQAEPALWLELDDIDSFSEYIMKASEHL